MADGQTINDRRHIAEQLRVHGTSHARIRDQSSGGTHLRPRPFSVECWRPPAFLNDRDRVVSTTFWMPIWQT